jgi:hypothetical protein
MDLYTRVLITKILCIALLGSAVTSQTPNHLAGLDRALQEALESQKGQETRNSEKEDLMRNENKNQGLVNTIVNHNNKLKVVENKINFIINNYANSSHVKEVMEKTKEVEKHVFGAPQPHSSWREFVLLLICILLILGAVIKAKNYGMPCICRYIHHHPTVRSTGITSISGQLDDSNRVNHTVLELKKLVEQQGYEHNKQMDIVMSKINKCLPAAFEPKREE